MLNVFVVCLPLWMQGGTQPVQLPPRVRSLSQLAGELSKQGVPVQCESSIANRLALINMQARAWDSLRPLLEQGLEVRFSRLPEGTWKLVADPAALAREKVLRDQFVARYRKGIADVLAPAWNAADEMRRMDKPQQEKKLDELRAVIGPPGAPGGTEAQVESVLLIQKMFWDNSERAAVFPLIQNFDLPALLQAPLFHTAHGENLAQEASNIGLRARAWLQSNRAPKPIPETAFTWYNGLRLDPLSLGVSESVYAVLGPNRFLFGSFNALTDTIKRLPFTMRDIFVEAAQGDALAANEQTTSTWLSQVGTNQKIALGATERTLSATVQKWSLQSGNEVVMEVSHQRDVLPGFNEIVPDLSVNISRALQSGHPPQEDESRIGVQTDIYGATGNYLAATPSVEKTPIDMNIRVWTAQQNDGVTLIHNQLAFLDNVALRNPAAALSLASTCAEHADHLLTFDNLLNASRLLSPRDNLLSADSTLYRGLGNYAGAHPYLRLLDKYPKLDQVRKDLAKDGVAYVECHDCSLSTLNSFGENLRFLLLIGPASNRSMRCFEPDFVQWVRQGIIQIKAEPCEFSKEGVWLVFRLYKSAELEGTQVTALPQELSIATVGPVHNPITSKKSKEADKP